MSMTSSPNDLTSRLRSRLEADRQQIEETAARCAPFESDTVAATTWMSVLLRRAWLRPMLAGLSLFSGSAAAVGRRCTGCRRASSAGSRPWRWRNLRIEDARETLVGLEETTWGMTLPAVNGEQYVALPAGTLVVRPSPWTPLDGQVTRLAEYYTTLAERSRGRWI